MAELKLPNYRIHKQLRQWDAEGRVYLAEHLTRKHWVELYVIPPSVSSFIEFTPIFKKLVVSEPIVHPNILKLLEIGEHQRWHYFAVEVFESLTLKDWLKKQSQFHLEDALSVARQLLSVFQAVASKLEQSVVLGQSEILINSGGQLKTHPPTLLQVPGPLQSSHYAAAGDAKLSFDPLTMTPEVLEHSSLVDQRSLVFSLGQVLYRMISGAWPFPTKSLRDLCMALEHESPKPPLDIKGAGSKGLSELVSCCLRVDPKQRPQSLAELDKALTAFC